MNVSPSRSVLEYANARKQDKENRVKKLKELGSTSHRKKQIREVFLTRDELYNPQILMNILKSGRE